MSSSTALDLCSYEKLEKAFKDRLQSLSQVKSDVVDRLFDNLCGVLCKKQILRLRKGDLKGGLANYVVKGDRVGSVDYFIEVLPYLDSQKLLPYIDEKGNIEGLVDKYFFTPGRWKVTSLYFEMKENGYNEEGVYDDYFNETGKDPYEKCNESDVKNFLHDIEVDMGLGDFYGD